MRNLLAVSCAFMLAGSALLAEAQDKPKKDDERVTVTGCLSVNPAARAYILTAKPDPMARTAGGIADEPTTIQYQLVGGSGLEQRVGNTVEVTGTVDRSTTATAKSESERTDAPRNGQQTDKKPKVETKTETKIKAQVMRVEAFRTISRTCTPTR